MVNKVVFVDELYFLYHTHRYEKAKVCIGVGIWDNISRFHHRWAIIEKILHGGGVIDPHKTLLYCMDPLITYWKI